jgi:hypothetical protein
MKSIANIFTGILTAILVAGTVSAAAARFTVAESTPNEPVVADMATGRMWQQGSTHEGSINWSGALEHCESMVYAGYDDWRLPSINELLSIVDEKKETQPAVNTTFFSGFDTFSAVWTSTTHRKQYQSAYVVYFNEQNSTVGRGGVGGLSKSFTAQVLCVRTNR